MFCAKCGTKIEDDSKFCFNCGTSLEVAGQQGAGQSEVTQPAALPDQPLATSVVRGKVLVYDQTIGKGTISSAGQRYDFNVASWLSDTPPHVGMVVEVRGGDADPTFSPVAESEIAKEKLSELSSKVGKQSAAIASDLSRKIGADVLVGYGVFAFGMFFLPFADVMFVKPTLYEVFKLGNWAVLVWLAVASVTLPQIWKDPRSHLAYLAPAGLLGMALFKALYTAYEAANTVGQMSSFFGVKPAETPSFITEAFRYVHFGNGFWLVICSAGWLVFKGFSKYAVASTNES